MENNDYQYGKIYKIVCNITNEIYIGSTINRLKQRLINHKKIHNTCVSRNIIDRGDYKIELIKNYPCNNKYELEEEEAKHIRNNTCINITIPHRTPEEYKKQYYEDKKEKFKEYYENNKEKLNEIKKQDRINNPEKYKQKENNRKNKQERLQKQKEKITCECGAIVARGGIAEHKRTMKHLKLTECLIID